MTMKLFGMYAMLLSLISCQTVETECFLIPQGFTGRVSVIFDQKKGAPVRYEGKTRIYDIPASGILLTQFKDDYGFINHHYFYVDKNGKRSELPIFEYKHQSNGTVAYDLKNKNEIGIFDDGTTGQYGNNEVAPFQAFSVSTLNGLDTLENFNHFNGRIYALLGIN